jgi:hypothetical protein
MNLKKNDVVRIRARDLPEVKKVHPFLQGTDELRVTRISREVGRKQVFLRDARDQLYLLWPEQLEIVRRAPPEPRRAAR